MKRTYTTILLTAVILASGCSTFGRTDTASESSSSVVTESSSESGNSSQDKNSQSSDTVESKEDASETDTLTREEVLAQIEQDLDTDVVQLPEYLPVRDDMYLTARIFKTDVGQEIIFYESAVQIPVNDTSLGDGETKAYPIARITVQHYASETKSLEEVGYMNFDESGGYEEIDLGYDITGYRDSATGQTYISWNEGRWSLSTAATTDDPQNGVDLAKEAVSFLEENILPAPNQYGSIKLDAINHEHTISWQEGTTVVVVDLIEDPIEALKTVTSIK